MRSILPDDDPSLREVWSPVTAQQLRPLDRRCQWLQFFEPLTQTDFKKVAKFLEQYPRVGLRAYRHIDPGSDLEFLRFFPFIRRLSIDLYNVRDFSGFAYVSPALRELSVGLTKSRVHSLGFLERFPRLHNLFIEGHTKDIEAIGALGRLQELTLRSITLPDLEILKPLGALKSLAIELGGTKSLSLLPEIGKIHYLKLFRVRGLADVEWLARVANLQFLFLQDLSNITRLPSFAQLLQLRRVHLDVLKCLEDLSPVAQAPALQELAVCGMHHLSPDAFRPFLRHPSLERVLVSLGSIRRNAAVETLLGLPQLDPRRLLSTYRADGTSKLAK